MKRAEVLKVVVPVIALLAFGWLGCTKGATMGGTEDQPAAIETAGAPAWDTTHYGAEHHPPADVPHQADPVEPPMEPPPAQVPES